MRTLTICISLILLAAVSANAQELEPVKQSPAKFSNQIYINDTIRSVEKVVYSDDSTAIDFQLSDDKTTIFLRGYDGKRSVRTVYTDKGGVPQDVTKPHCHIHDMMVL